MRLERFLRAVAISVVVSLVLVGGVIGCSGGPDAKSAKVAPGPMPEGESWTGVYFHPVYGYLHLVEEGSNIVGKWKRADQSHWGRLSGTFNGNVFHYTWEEHKIGMIGASATTKGKGFFVYKLDKEGRPVLDGQFGLGNDETGSDWHCVKQQRMQPDLNSIGGDAEGVPPGGF